MYPAPQQQAAGRHPAAATEASPLRSVRVSTTPAGWCGTWRQETFLLDKK